MPSRSCTGARLKPVTARCRWAAPIRRVPLKSDARAAAQFGPSMTYFANRRGTLRFPAGRRTSQRNSRTAIFIDLASHERSTRHSSIGQTSTASVVHMFCNAARITGRDFPIMSRYIRSNETDRRPPFSTPAFRSPAFARTDESCLHPGQAAGSAAPPGAGQGRVGDREDVVRRALRSARGLARLHPRACAPVGPRRPCGRRDPFFPLTRDSSPVEGCTP